MTECVQRAGMLQRKTPERRIVCQGHKRAVQAAPLEDCPDENRGGRKRPRFEAPAIQLPLRERTSAARCSGGVCSSSRYRPLRNTCEAPE
jgi:hypothetical protein